MRARAQHTQAPGLHRAVHTNKQTYMHTQIHTHTQTRTHTDTRDRHRHRHTQMYPGFHSAVQALLDREDVELASRHLSPSERA